MAQMRKGDEFHIRLLVPIALAVLGFASASPAYAADIAALRERAQQGDVDAQIELAKAYADAGNTADSQNWMLRAAEEGSPRAQNLMGNLVLESE